MFIYLALKVKIKHHLCQDFNLEKGENQKKNIFHEINSILKYVWFSRKLQDLNGHLFTSLVVYQVQFNNQLTMMDSLLVLFYKYM